MQHSYTNTDAEKNSHRSGAGAGAPKKGVIVNPSHVATRLTELINNSQKTQRQIATESGFEKTNIITMLKSGRTKFPIRRTKDFSQAVGCDAYELLETVMQEYMPEVLEVIEEHFWGRQEAGDTRGKGVAMTYTTTKLASGNPDAELFCVDFYFVHTSGDHLYPIRMENRDTGTSTFRLSEGGNTKLAGWESNSIEEVKQYVLDMGCSVRCNTLNKTRDGLFSPNGRSIRKVVKLR
jgi:hypothetical protein